MYKWETLMLYCKWHFTLDYSFLCQFVYFIITNFIFAIKMQPKPVRCWQWHYAIIFILVWLLMTLGMVYSCIKFNFISSKEKVLATHHTDIFAYDRYASNFNVWCCTNDNFFHTFTYVQNKNKPRRKRVMK